MPNASTTVLGRRFAWWEQVVQHRTADTTTTWSAYKWWVAGIIMLAAVMVALSFEALTLALPTMMASMRVGLNEMSWTITAYMISRTLFVGSVGWLGNRLGNRNLFVLGLALFTGGALLCGLAWNFEALIVFRVLQGIGAGPLMPLTMVFLQESFPPAQRGLAQGLYLVGDATGSILGRVLVGYLIDYLGWRSIFYVIVPFGVIALGLLIVLVPNRRETLVSLAIEQRQAHHMQLLTQNQSQTMLEVQPTLAHLQALFQHQGDVESEASHNALSTLNDLLLSEASVAAYQECYVGVALLYTLALLPLLALRRRDTAPARSAARVVKARSER
jgi:MFS family permease